MTNCLRPAAKAGQSVKFGIRRKTQRPECFQKCLYRRRFRNRSAGIVGWFVLSPQYAADTPDEIPVIRRPKDAIKIQPENPGGMEILNQDKTVYNIIDKKGVGDTPAVETILPPPEEPQLPIIVPEAEPAEPPAPAVPSTEKTIAAAEEIIRAETTPPARTG